MNVHNLMEEYVEERVRDIYRQLEKQNTAWLNCSCESCILDSISYVLNRVMPHYIVSGRGAVYSAQALDNHQLRADVDALSIEAVRTINSVQRPYHKITSRMANRQEKIEKPSFNFPVIEGAVFDGNTFEPVIDASIILKDEKGTVIMQDFSWPNPCKTFGSTKGAFSFWPESKDAEKTDTARRFSFLIEVSRDGYTPVTHHFDITLTSDEEKTTHINHSYTMKLPDIILFKNSK